MNYQELRQTHLPNDKTLIRFAFSSKRRKMGTVLFNANGNGDNLMRLHEKGAPETILYSCKEIYTFEVIF